MKILLSVLAGLAFLGSASLLPGQVTGQEILGGRWRQIRFHQGTIGYFGQVVAGGGDLDGDGVPDYLIGSAPRGTDLRVTAFSGKTGSKIGVLNGQAPFGTFPNSCPGFSIAFLGDLDGDGLADFGVGNPRVGKVSVFSGPSERVLFRINGPSPEDWFGFSIAGVPDLDGDGIRDFLVGAPHASPNAVLEAGSAFLYSGASGVLLRRWDGKRPQDHMGFSVADARDVDGDGVSDLLLGAPQADFPGRPNAGLALVVSGATGTPWKRFHGRFGGSFVGFSVAGPGDVDQDGFADVLAGGPYAHQTSVYNRGEGFLFSGAFGQILWEGTDSSESEGEPLAGFSVAPAGDLNGDGYPDWMVGAPQAGGYTAGFLSGAIQIRFGPKGNLFQRFAGYKECQQMGFSLAPAGDLNGDGNPDFLVGIPGHERVGGVAVWTFQPFLKTDVQTLSASAGGTAHLELGFPHSAGGQEFTILASLHGTGPTVLWGVDIPLTPDFLYDRLLGGNPPPPLRGNHGLLDASGKAAVTFTFPAGVLAPALGRTFSVAAIAAPGPGFVSFASVAHRIRILP